VPSRYSTDLVPARPAARRQIRVERD
jgi:hypothetical protein